MKEFSKTKVIRRHVKIRSFDRALADADWVLTFTASGVRIRRLHERKADEKFLSWRSVIGHRVMHADREARR